MFIDAERLPFCERLAARHRAVRNELIGNWVGRFSPWPQPEGYTGTWELLPLFACDEYDAPGTLREEASRNRVPRR